MACFANADAEEFHQGLESADDGTAEHIADRDFPPHFLCLRISHLVLPSKSCDSRAMNLSLTNSEIADLVAGLKVAIEATKTVIDANTPAMRPRNQKEKGDYRKWGSQIKRWHKLHRILQQSI